MKNSFWMLTIMVTTLFYACQPQDTIDKQVEQLLSQMTLEEKIGQMNQLDPSWETEMKENLIREGKVVSVFNIVCA